MFRADHAISRYRHHVDGYPLGDECNGFFILPPNRKFPFALRIMAASGMGWEHVSVSTAARCPTWEEMCFVKSHFWGPEDVVMQLHPKESEYVNQHNYCLHLWRPIGLEIPTPPKIMVG